MKAGDVIFFKRVKTSLRKNAPETQFEGHGFGILLGSVPLHTLPPPLPIAMAALGSIGLVSLNDIIDYVGQETMEKIARANVERYGLKQPPKKEDEADEESRVVAEEAFQSRVAAEQEDLAKIRQEKTDDVEVPQVPRDQPEGLAEPV